MPSLEVRPFSKSDVESAAEILAAAQVRASERLPFLNAALGEPAIAAEVVRRHVRNAREKGLSAFRGGRLAGFAFAELNLFGPDHFASQYVPPHSTSIAFDAHAVAPGEDATDVYRALYSTFAADWIREGFFVHRAYIMAGDLEAQEAWVALGFGRHTTSAVRITEPVEAPADTSIEVHRAGTEDLAVVLSLAHDLSVHHVAAPIFWPYLRTTDAAARAFHEAALADERTPYFIAYRGGQPLGMQTFLQPGFIPDLVVKDRNIYLYEGVVTPAAQRGGVGRVLLAHSMTWARENGYKYCTLHFASGNPAGAPFWLGQGFVPVEHTMERTVDSRIAWANR